MSFVFKSAKNLEIIPRKLKVNKLYKEKGYSNEINFNNKSAFVPFLSNSEKLFEKIKETPGPGQYNIQKGNYIHKQYIKKNIEQYKESFNDFVNFMNNFGTKFQDYTTPGPGHYNPAENKNFGAKIKKQNIFRKYLLNNQNENLIKNIFYINNSENEKNISKNLSNISSKEIRDNEKNISINFNKTKKMGKSNDKIFKKLLFIYSQLKEEENSSLFKDKEKDKESSYSKEEDFSSSNHTNNISKSNLQLKLYNLKKSNSTKNFFLKKVKAKIYKTIDDHIRIKEISEQKKLEMKAFSAKSNYYLEKYLNSKLFSQVPGPGYYFTKPPPSSLVINRDKIERIKKNINKKLISEKYNQNKNNKEKIKLISENQRMKKIPLSKTMHQLKNDIIKKDFEKVKEVHIKNKYNNIMDKLIKKQLIEAKENKYKNPEQINKNNSREIQEEGYPIKYIKYILSEKKDKNNAINFNSNEKRFIGHTGWRNEIIKNENPGPGEYNLDTQSISKKNKNIISSNIFRGFQIPKERKLFTDEIKNTNPPVGTYQSHYFNSIEYKNHSKNFNINVIPIKDGFQKLYKAKTKKRVEDIKFNEQKANSMLGPASYFDCYNNISTIIEHKNSNKNFSSKEIKDNNNKGYNNKNINHNNYWEYYQDLLLYSSEPNKWIKKTFNASFV